MSTPPSMTLDDFGVGLEFGDKFLPEDIWKNTFADLEGDNEVIIPTTASALLDGLLAGNKKILLPDYTGPKLEYTLSLLNKVSPGVTHAVNIDIDDNTVPNGYSKPEATGANFYGRIYGIAGSALPIFDSKSLNGCQTIRAVAVPTSAALGRQSLSNCPNLKIVDLPKLESVYYDSFSGSTSIEYLNIGFMHSLTGKVASTVSIDMSMVYLFRKLRLFSYKGIGKITFTKPNSMALDMRLPDLEYVYFPNITGLNANVTKPFRYSGKIKELDFSSVNFMAPKTGKTQTDNDDITTVTTISKIISRSLALRNWNTDLPITLIAKRFDIEQLIVAPWFPFGLGKGCTIIGKNGKYVLPGYTF